MKVLDYYSISISNIKGNKKAFFKNIILMAISLAMLIFSSIATESINNILEKNIKNNLSYRTIYVRNNQGINQKNFMEKIKEIKHVAKVITQEEYYSNIDIYSINGKETSGGVSLIGSNNDISPEVINGRKIKNDETGVCIIPKKFQTQNLSGNINDNQIIDGESLLNKEIEVVYHNYDYSGQYPKQVNTIIDTYKVIGVYDQDINMGEYYECYINFDDVLKIQNEINRNSNYDNELTTVLAIVDNSENVNSVIDILEDFGYEAFPRSIPNTKLIGLIESFCTAISICIIIIVLSSIIINTIRNAEEKKQELGLLKAFGYNNKTLWKTIVVESIIIGITSFILACALALVVILIVYYIMQNSGTELKRITITINYDSFLYCLLISLFIPMLGNVISSNNIVKKATIVKNLKK